MRGTPCKCCSKSQQRSSPGLRLRLTALLVFSCENHLVGSDLLCAGGHTNTYTHNKAPMTQLHSIHTHCCLSKRPHQKTNQFIGRCHPYARKSTSKAVLSRMQLTLHATRPTPHGALLLVQPMSAWLGKTWRAPYRHCRGVRVYGHTITAMHDMRTPPASFDALPIHMQERSHEVPKPASQAVLTIDRMKLTLRTTPRTPHGASPLAQAMSTGR